MAYSYRILCFGLYRSSGSEGPNYPDETRYAEIAREMIESGDWISPRLDGLRYFEKPPLGYWVHAASLLLLGENNFAVRLPEATAVGLSAIFIILLVYNAHAETWGKDASFTAALAGLIFLSCLEVAGVGNTAVLDSLFSFFVTITMAALFTASEAHSRSRAERVLLVLAGLACGLAFLTKGFLAFAFPVLAFGSYLIWERRYRDLLRMAWLPVLTASLTILPWAVLIHLREPDFWRFFFWHEHIHRFFSTHAQHRKGFWYFFIMAPLIFMPWSSLAPATAHVIKADLAREGPRASLARLATCWLVAPFLFLSFSKGKVITYVLPCFPAFAILLCLGLSRTKITQKPIRWAIIANASVFMIIFLALLYFQLFGPQPMRPYTHIWPTIAAITGLLAFVLSCVLSLHVHTIQRMYLLLSMGLLLLLFVAHFIVPDPIRAARCPGPLLERYARHITSHDLILSHQNTIRAACWYLKRSDVYLLDGAGELSYGLKYKDAKGRGLNIKSASRLIMNSRARVVLLANIRKHRDWLARLPKPVFKDGTGRRGFIIWMY